MRAPMSAPMVYAEGLGVRLPDGTWPLRGLDLSVPQGAFALLCGANGSGKTTLLHALAGLLLPAEGSLQVAGLDPARQGPELRRQVGLVFSDAGAQLLAETVAQDVAIGPLNHGLSAAEANTRVDEVLQRLDLTDLADRPCHHLSGGERRRVALAGVLALRPRLLLLDEPFGGLDYPSTRALLATLVALHGDGHTVVLATHDLDRMAAHADLLALIASGRVTQQGTVAELLPELAAAGVRPPCHALLGLPIPSWLSALAQTAPDEA